MRELLIEIWTSVRRNKLRTFLTGFSVAWGIFMLSILLGSGNGLRHGIESTFENEAINSISLYQGWTSKPYMGYQKWRHIKLYNSDLEILKREFPEVDQVAAVAWFNDRTAAYGNEYTSIVLRGSLPHFQQIEGVQITRGRFINELDISKYRKSLVIDEATQSLFFKGSDPLGARIKLDTVVYTVVGVFKGDARRNSSMGYIPLSTGQLLYNKNKPDIDEAAITLHDINTDEQMDAFEKRIIRRLAAEHHFDPDDESAIWIENRMESYKNVSMVFAGINIFVWIIGLGTLFAGIVGVSNIMLVTVTERTSEFGIRKALGAKPSSIIRLILTESVLITALFGYTGMVLGVGVMEGVNYYLNHAPADPSGSHMGSVFLNPTLDLGIAVSATIVLVLAGLIAGYIPAYRAAQLKTIDALRHNK